MKVALSAVALAFMFGFGSVKSAPATTSVPPPADFSISSFGVNGSGCPAGSATYYFNDDKTSLNVYYSKFYAETGPNIPISENRKNCQLTLGVRVPAGFSFALVSTQARGYYYLDPSVYAAQETLYYFQGSLSQANATQRVVGPVPGAYYSYDSKFPISTFSPCGTNTVLNIDTSIQANNNKNANGSGYIATDATNVAFTQLFNFVWQAC